MRSNKVVMEVRYGGINVTGNSDPSMDPNRRFSSKWLRFFIPQEVTPCAKTGALRAGRNRLIAISRKCATRKHRLFRDTDCIQNCACKPARDKWRGLLFTFSKTLDN